MTKHSEALGITSCPKCGAEKRSPCVYLVATYGAQQQHPAGTPTVYPHIERLRKAQDVRRRESRKTTRVPPPHPYVAAEVHERAELRRWLHRFGYVLTSKG